MLHNTFFPKEFPENCGKAKLRCAWGRLAVVHRVRRREVAKGRRVGVGEGRTAEKPRATPEYEVGTSWLHVLGTAEVSWLLHSLWQALAS